MTKSRFTSRNEIVNQKRSSVDNFIINLGKKARKAGVKTKEQLFSFLRKETASGKLNEKMANKVWLALNQKFIYEKYGAEKKQEGRKIKKEELEDYFKKEISKHSVQTAYLNAYFDLISKGEVPSVINVTNRMKKYGLKIKQKNVAEIAKTIGLGLPLKKKLRHVPERNKKSKPVEDKILELNKKFLEKGEKRVVRKLEGNFTERACINLFERGWKIEDIANELGLPKHEVVAYIKKNEY